ncbi:LCP family protein [Streptomyces sp. NBC_00487]|uniref:LCP family protein n=1 Tax=unclassified Streptomyces TaxID=2593676 RepID=UPI002DDC65FA|nr:MULTISPECIES: LCP family protein [unclassified Streptomyces]WRY98030.1 LCP family protein [Streptomyces sp. NBC_00481]
MDAQGRGRADDIDPADQWVLNPSTGEYELRLSPSAPQSAVPRPRRAAPVAAGARATAGASARSASAATDTREIPDTLPGPRRRRGTPEEDPLPGRRGGRGRTKPKKSVGKRILVWTAGSLAFLVVGVSAAGYLYYQHLNDNIDKISDDGAGTGGFSKDRAINLVVIGTDKRTGEGNEKYGDSGSVGHADTTILLHVSKDRTNATAMSIPRDMIVDIPDCPTTQEDGSEKNIAGTQNVRFNTSLGQDGRTPSCTMRTVEELTGIKPDHFMVADFNAVKTLSTAIGGVEVCLAKPINDEKSKLNLPAGEHTIEGEQALAFLRTRYSVGLGSDLSRIELQQQFLSSMIRQMKSKDTLTDPTKVLSLAEAATDALSVDSGITDIKKLASLGQEVGKVKTKNISFTTVPVVDNTDGATVLPTPQKAEQLFATIRKDISLTEVKKQAKEKEAAKLKGTRAKASEVRVNVYNGGAEAGSAQATLNWLQNDVGVTKSSQLGNADKTLKKTTLAYDPDQADQARKLADLMGLSASALKPGKGNSETNSQGLPAMVLTLGKDFEGAGVSLSATSAADLDVQKSTADKEKCAS